MFADDSAQLIYCSHAFNYFDRVQGRDVLREWHRVLQPSGVLRLAVSDFEALAKLYEGSGDLNQILGPLFGRMIIQAPDGERVMFMRTTYDYQALEALCREAGFRDVQRYDWRKTIHRDFDDFSQAYVPHMDKERGTLISLNIEARK
jgi:predicted SAM-dependent methyltransferase